MAAIDIPWRRTSSKALLIGLVVIGVGLVFAAVFWYLRIIVLAAWTLVDQAPRF